MDKNLYSDGAVGDSRQRVGTGTFNRTSDRRRPGITRPSPRAIQSVFQWIDEAETASKKWARNALMVLGVIVALVLLAAGMDLLPQ